MRLDECAFCGLNAKDLSDDIEVGQWDTETLFEVSKDGKQMACHSCAIGRDGFPQWEPKI